jgi:ATP-dependent RNA helicase RhlE
MPELVRAVEEMGFTRPTPVQADAIPPASGPRRAGVRDDGQRQDGGVPAADPAAAGGQAARPDARAHAEPDARAGGADAGAPGGAGEAHAPHVARRSTAVSAWAAGGRVPRGVDIIAATPGRLLDHMSTGLREARGHRGAGAGRGGPHAGHGLPAGHPRVLRQLPQRPRQTLFFSATMPQPIVELSRELLAAGAHQRRAEAGAGDTASRRRSIRCRRT